MVPDMKKSNRVSLFAILVVVLFVSASLANIFLPPSALAGEDAKAKYEARSKALDRIIKEMSTDIPKDNKIVVDDLVTAARKSAKDGKYVFANRILDEVFKILYRGTAEETWNDTQLASAMSETVAPPKNGLAVVKPTVDKGEYAQGERRVAGCELGELIETYVFAQCQLNDLRRRRADHLGLLPRVAPRCGCTTAVLDHP